MHVVDADALVEEVVRQVLRHALRERGHEHALLAGDAGLYLVQKVVYLAAYRPELHLRIEQARRPDDLLHLVLAHVLLVVAGGRGHIDELGDALLELVEAQRPVVERGRKAEAVVHERDLARAVALVHAPDLRYRHVRLVDDAEHVAREVVDQRVRGLARPAAVHVPRVVLDAGAVAHGLEHLDVVAGPLAQALRLEDHVVVLQLLDAVLELLLYRLDGMVDLRPRRDVVGRRPDGNGVVLADDLARDAVYLRDELHLVAEEAYAQRVLGIGREHVHGVAAHAEHAALQVVVVPVVLDVDELVHEVVALQRHALVHVWREPRVVLGAADAVDAADGRDHDDVAPAEEARRGLVAELLDLLVDGGVLLYVRVRLRYVGLRLVVVVVAHEVHDGVVGEELAHLARDLRRERLVGLHDERGLLHRLDGLGHREGLATSRDAQKRLVAKAVLHALRKACDGLWLVACGLVRRDHLEPLVPVLHAEALELRPIALLGLARPGKGLVLDGLALLVHERALLRCGRVFPRESLGAVRCHLSHVPSKSERTKLEQVYPIMRGGVYP